MPNKSRRVAPKGPVMVPKKSRREVPKGPFKPSPNRGRPGNSVARRTARWP